MFSIGFVKANPQQLLPERGISILTAIRVAVISFIWVSSVYAEKKHPPDLQPLPEIPPPPNLIDDALSEPEITIRQNTEEKVEEVRQNGRLLFIKVTPSHGYSYYLVPNKLTGGLMRQNQLDSELVVPVWILKRF